MGGGGGIAFNLKSNDLLSEKIQEDEKIRFNWTGKNWSKTLKDIKTETVLVPNIEHNKNYKDTKNIIVIGDNLDCLKHLKQAYSNKIKMIYIDPPYNTGGDGFIYEDSKKWTDDDLKRFGYNEEKIKEIRKLEGKCSHSAWLSFMLPRLEIAKKLLRDDGVIFISIDDNEQANLKLLCDDVFGEREFVENIIWRKKNAGANNADFFAKQHEYILCYSKNNNTLNDLYIDFDNKYLKRYNEKDNMGSYFWDTYGRSMGREIDILSPDNTKIKIKVMHSLDNVLDMIKRNELKFYKNKNNKWGLQIKQRLNENGKKPQSILYDLCFNQNGTEEIKTLFGGELFSFPKPTSLIKHLLKIATSPNTMENTDNNDNANDIILDFFAGSGTTADAVMQLNNEDGGNRQFILCQLDEKISNDKPAYQFCIDNKLEPVISNITIERVKRAKEKIEQEKGKLLKMDNDFKIYRCKDLKIETIDKILKFNPNKKDLFENMITPFSSETMGLKEYNASGIDTLLTTWLPNDGYNFETEIEKIDFKGSEGYKAKEHLYIFKEWSSDATKELLNKIGKNELIIRNIVIYAYHFDFIILTELKNNLKTSLDEKHKINFMERF